MDYIFDIFIKYGVLIIFLMIFLEQLNLPGLAAGIILPAVGFLVHRGEVSFFTAIIICIIAGVLASLVLYLIGYIFGSKILDFIVKKFPKLEKAVNKSKEMSENAYGRIFCRFLPGVRTLVPLIEGGMKINFSKSVIASSIGVSVYNLAFVTGGYLLAIGIIR